MIERSITEFLNRWKHSFSRLPLIVRGARQVGKTTVIHEFGKSYDQYLYFNLEKTEDARIFYNTESIENLVRLLFLSRNLVIDKNKSNLLFIDEVQELPQVLEQLRYFHEEFPFIHIITTGSLLDFAIDKIIKVPVGPVEFVEIHPLSFKEFLKAKDKDQLLDRMISDIPLSNLYHDICRDLFHEYAMLGGMPMIVSNYLQDKSVVRLKELYHAITEAYKTDVSKYAKNLNQANIIRQIIELIPYTVDQRINMSKFASSHFKSIEIKNGLLLLEQARIIKLVYPTIYTTPPIIQDSRKRPRLHYLDIGLLNYQLGLQQEYLMLKNLNGLYKGALMQQIVYQEIKAQEYLSSHNVSFWVREEKGTSSEIDLVIPFKSHLIPVEIKSGASGTLRSLHEFMDRCNHRFAVRVYDGPIKIDKMNTRKGKEYRLLNLPYYLSGLLDKYLDWFVFLEN